MRRDCPAPGDKFSTVFPRPGKISPVENGDFPTQPLVFHTIWGKSGWDFAAFGENRPLFHRKGGFPTGDFPAAGGELWNSSTVFLAFYLLFSGISPIFHPVFHTFHWVFHSFTVEKGVECVENPVETV